MLRYSRSPVDFAGRITPQSNDANRRVNLQLGDTVMYMFYHVRPTVCFPVQQIGRVWTSAGYLWLHAALTSRMEAYWWRRGR